MREIRLVFLALRNFKGCGALELRPEGRSMSIYGDNATGKTTVYDALTWLLFGKDSRGRVDFEIKPLAPDGSVRDHAAVSEVAAVLSCDGTEVELRKTYFERWSTKRGSSEATYDGNTCEFFVDGVPMKKYEFEDQVERLVDERLFRLLTSVTWFCEGLGWQERRKLLLDMCDIPEDREIMASQERFLGLCDATGALDVESYRRKLQARRKALNGARSTIPARLDEQKRLIATLEGVDFSADEAERASVAAQMEQLSGELVTLGHGSLLDEKRNETRRLELELAELRHENEVHRASQAVPVLDERPGMQASLVQIRARARRSGEAAAGEERVIATAAAAIEETRRKWREIDGEQFVGSVCPTCGQTLPAKAQEEALRRFEADKDRRKGEVVASADLLKRELAEAQKRADRWRADEAQAQKEAELLEDRIARYVPETAPEITDLPGYQEKARALAAELKKMRDAVASLEGETGAIRQEITRKIASLKERLAALDGRLARKELLSLARSREAELRAEAQKTAGELEEIDRYLFLCDEFTRYKTGFIQDSVNGRFELCRWKLYDEQVNGALADCCEATYDGVPYGSLNNGMRVNIGIDVIRTVSGHYGLRVPLVVDNAESVSALMDAGTQVIRLVVSESDKELRFTYED